MRERFPDRDPYRAWSNFEFVDHDGSINEVDLLVFSPRGAFLVEIKSWPEPTEGDGGTWARRLKNGRRRALDNPRLLANRKAKRLKSLLENEAHKRGERNRKLPFMEALVFLSHPNVKVELNPQGRTGVCLRDVDDGSPPGGMPGIVEAVSKITEKDKRRRNFKPWSSKDAQRFAELLDGIGIRETTKHRKVGDWELGELLEEGEGWQEFTISRPDAPEIERRARIFGAGSNVDRNLLSAAAKREFQTLEPIEHPGILAPKDLIEAEQGPALIYSASPGAERLDHYLEASASRLSIDQRIGMVRQIGEAIAYAHARGLIHRSLKPSSILVVDDTDDDEAPQLQIRDWHVAHRITGETKHTGTLTAHADLLIEEAADVYLAPEAARRKSGSHIDVFSLGAIAFHIFTGRPPAPSLIEREAHLRQHGGLDIAAVIDGAGDTQRLAVLYATCPEVSKRTESVKAFLANLDDLEAELAPEDGSEGNPTSAAKGDTLAGYEVKARLGRGGTAIAYLVESEGEEFVLKVAASIKNNDRIREEAEVLAKVRDHAVVQVHRDDIKIAGHAALLIDLAGKETLAERIRKGGPPGLELLERWGEDLIRAVSSLESQGVAHRDIKPDNIGIRKRPPNDQLRLTLFDFSLSRAPLEALSAGTPDYIDPFLRDAKRGKWDLAAERFSLAMTLHEMATGQLPRWGDGLSDPNTIETEVSLEEALFDPGVAPALCEFFQRALSRDASQRFDSAEDMLTAWRACFAGAGPTKAEKLDPAKVNAALETAAVTTPIGELPFSARATSALRGAGIASAGDLIASSAFELRSLTGVGAETRDEILYAHGRLRDRLAAEEAPDVQSLDMLSRQLIPTKSWEEADLAILRDYLGLEGSLWPSAAELSESSGRDRVEIEKIVTRGRERWYKSLTSVRRLSDEIAEQLESAGFLPVPMLEESVLATRGAAMQGEERQRAASACLRAALEAESYKESPRFALARNGEIRVISKTEKPEPGAALDYLVELGKRMDAVVENAPVPVERAGEALRTIESPPRDDEQTPPTAERLCRLATTASSRVTINERGEVYPIGLEPRIAIEYSAGSLLPSADKRLGIAEIEKRVRIRFPQAAGLPARPKLDQLLAEIGLEWDSAEAGYGTKEMTESMTRVSRGSTTDLGDEGISQFGQRLAGARDRFLALTAYAKYAGKAERRLASSDGVTVVSLDALLIRHMRDVATEKSAKWEAILRVDEAGPSDKNWLAIDRVAGEAADRVREELLATPGTVVLTSSGLLARYRKMDMLHELRRQIEDRSSDHPLNGLWLLVPTESKDARPVIDGEPVPVLDANEWAHVPKQWILAE